MFTNAKVFDLSVYMRIREKANIFPRFALFAEACETLNVLLANAFELIYEIKKYYKSRE
jgi:hypothetical protein